MLYQAEDILGCGAKGLQQGRRDFGGEIAFPLFRRSCPDDRFVTGLEVTLIYTAGKSDAFKAHVLQCLPVELRLCSSRILLPAGMFLQAVVIYWP